MKLKSQSGNSFRDKRVSKGKFIGKNGRCYVSLSPKGGWDSKTRQNLKMHCWQSRFGDY